MKNLDKRKKLKKQNQEIELMIEIQINNELRIKMIMEEEKN